MTWAKTGDGLPSDYLQGGRGVNQASGDGPALAAVIAAHDADLGAVKAAAAQLIIAAGATAIDLTARIHAADGSAAGNNITSALADGAVDGQVHRFVLNKITSAKTWVITPAHFFDGTTITLSVAEDSVDLFWSAAAGKWRVLAKGGSTAIA